MREGTPIRDRERSVPDEDLYLASTSGSPFKRRKPVQDAPRGPLSLGKADNGVEGEIFSMVWRRPKKGLPPPEDMEEDSEILEIVEHDLVRIEAKVAVIRAGIREEMQRKL